MSFTMSFGSDFISYLRLDIKISFRESRFRSCMKAFSHILVAEKSMASSTRRVQCTMPQGAQSHNLNHRKLVATSLLPKSAGRRGGMAEFEVPFFVFGKMLDAIARSSKSAMKKKPFNTFLKHVLPDAAERRRQRLAEQDGPSHHEPTPENEMGKTYFSVLRLMVPELDRDRAIYGMRESALGRCLADALGLARDSETAHKLEDWRSGGRGQHGINAGKFVEVAAEVRLLVASVASPLLSQLPP